MPQLYLKGGSGGCEVWLNGVFPILGEALGSICSRHGGSTKVGKHLEWILQRSVHEKSLELRLKQPLAFLGPVCPKTQM